MNDFRRCFAADALRRRLRAAAAPVVIAVVGGFLLAPPVEAAPPTCTDFQTRISQGVSDLHADFRRSLVVTRGSDTAGADYYDLTTAGAIQGTLQCKGEHFLRFEATIGVPADTTVADQYARLENTALEAVLGWAPAKSAPVLLSMSNDASQYLRASIQRGDIYISGKTEEHEPGGIDLGLLWTPSERTFIIVSG